MKAEWEYTTAIEELVAKRAEVQRLREVIEVNSKTMWEQQAEIARLRRIEEAAYKVLGQYDSTDEMDYAALRAALEEK